LFHGCRLREQSHCRVMNMCPKVYNYILVQWEQYNSTSNVNSACSIMQENEQETYKYTVEPQLSSHPLFNILCYLTWFELLLHSEF
jgi:hypothetical protein